MPPRPSPSGSAIGKVPISHGTLAAAVIRPLAIEPVRDDILRCLGYRRETPPPAGTKRLINRAVAEALGHLRPRGVYALYALTARTTAMLRFGGVTIRGRIGDYLQGADRIAVVLATAGDEISVAARARAAAGDDFGAWVFDAVGSWAAEAAAEALSLHLRVHLGAGDGLTLRYSPGYCGMALAEQRVLFRLADAAAAGLTLLPSLLMHPLKSVSGLVGLGPREAIRVDLSPCQLCPLTGCHMRR